MSIAVLKKKSATKYSKNISRGKDGFSINGTIRLKGVVGTTNLAVSVTRTRFKGTHPVGSGGHAGAYPIVVANSGHCNAEGGFVPSEAYPSNVKLSTKNTKGAIKSKNKWMNGGYPYKPGALGWWVTPINSSYNIVNSAGQYIEKKQSLNYCNMCDTTGKDPFNSDAGSKTVGCCSRGKYVGSRLVPNTHYAKHIGANNQQFDRLQKLKYPLLNPSSSQKPFPFRIIHDGCDVNYMTLQDAQAANAFD